MEFRGRTLTTSCRAPLDSLLQIKSLESHAQLFSGLLGSGRDTKRIARRADVLRCLCRAGSRLRQHPLRNLRM